MSKIFSKTELDMSLCQIGNVSKTVMLYGWKILKVLLWTMNICIIVPLQNKAVDNINGKDYFIFI